jgi:hypothetical protein
MIAGRNRARIRTRQIRSLLAWAILIDTRKEKERKKEGEREREREGERRISSRSDEKERASVASEKSRSLLKTRLSSLGRAFSFFRQYRTHGATCPPFFLRGERGKMFSLTEQRVSRDLAASRKKEGRVE